MAAPVADSYSVPAGKNIAGGMDAFLSPENVPGSYNAGSFQWTPGRGSDGRITRASLNLLPTDGTWVEVMGTGFVANVGPLLSAALPGYNDPGATDLADVLDGYNGFAHDKDGGRVFAHGGGHQGSANNGLYRLDLNKLAWSIARLPDMQTYWPANYKTNPPRDNSYTIYTRAKDYIDANPTTTDVYSDEFYDAVEPLANTRNPTSRHTYNAMVFAGGKLRHGVRRYWEWDEATGAWTRRYPLGKNATTHKQSGGGYAGENVSGTWDEANNRYICTPTYTDVVSSGWAYNAGSGTWSYAPSGLVGGYQAYFSAFARRGRDWCSIARPCYQGDYWPPTLRAWSLDTGAVVTTQLTGLVQSRCIDVNKYDESSVMEYVPELGKFLLLMPYDAADAYAAGANLPLEPFLIDPGAATITHTPQAGAWPAMTSLSLVKSKFFYSAKLRALVLVRDSATNIRIRRLA